MRLHSPEVGKGLLHTSHDLADGFAWWTHHVLMFLAQACHARAVHMVALHHLSSREPTCAGWPPLECAMR